jgi:hypothetical protein
MTREWKAVGTTGLPFIPPKTLIPDDKQNVSAEGSGVFTQRSVSYAQSSQVVKSRLVPFFLLNEAIFS